MKFNKAFLEDQFRGFEVAKDKGNNVIAVRVKKDNAIIAVWKVRDSRNLDAVIAEAIEISIKHKIVSVCTIN